MKTLTVKAATAIVGSKLGQTTKMPCRSFGLPTHACVTGSALREIEGTACWVCYAASPISRYGAPTVVAAQERRLAALGHPQWIEAMTLLIEKYSPDFFRWFDSGDLQSVEHLNSIITIARRLPDTRFWLPTQERAMVKKWRDQHGAFPSNLCIRVSAVMLGGHIGAYRGDPELTASLVLPPGQATPPGAHLCPAYTNGHKCGTCRACFSRDVKLVAYPQH